MVKIIIGHSKKSKAEQTKEYMDRQKEKGFLYFGLLLHRRVIDKLNRLAARFKVKDATCKRTWTRTSLITRSVSDLYNRVFTTTTVTIDPVMFETACKGDNVRVGYLPVFSYIKKFLHSGHKYEIVCGTREEAIERAKRPDGGLRKDFIGVLEIRYKAD